MSAVSLHISVADPTQVGDARRQVQHLARKALFSDDQMARVGILVTEAATNILKHAQTGEVLAQVREDTGDLEILALDRGAGMANPEVCLRDGYSTTATSGTGLGALRRMSDFFDIYSQPEKGTALLMRIRKHAEPAHSVLSVGGVCVPAPGETVCGDAWTFEVKSDHTSFLVVDGLGHGPEAHRAAVCAVEAFHESGTRRGIEVLQSIHDALRITRGGAAAICEFSPAKSQAEYSGIGNISGVLAFPAEAYRTKHLVSQNGTVGHIARRLQSFTYDWNAGAMLIMHSDGLATNWKIEQYPGLTSKDATLIAAVLYRDFTRKKDDVTVLVAKGARS